MHAIAITVELHLPSSNSLKDKRSSLKPLLVALHRQFNVSAAEIDLNDAHRSAVIACVVVSNSAAHGQRVVDGIPAWIESRRPDLQIIDHSVFEL